MASGCFAVGRGGLAWGLEMVAGRREVPCGTLRFWFGGDGDTIIFHGVCGGFIAFCGWHGFRGFSQYLCGPNGITNFYGE